MAVVPRNLGLVAALAVSGTTLYLVYEYNKKRALVNIQRGKGSWRLEYLHGGSDIPQQQPVVKKESGECVDIGIEEELQWHQLRWLRKAAVRRLLPKQQPLVLLPTVPEAEQESRESGNESHGRTEETFKDRLVNCGVDEAQVNGVPDAGNHHRRQQQQRREHVTNFSIAVTSTGRFSSQSEFQGSQENSDSNLAAVSMSSSSNDSRIQERALTDSCSEADFSCKSSLSSAASSPSAQKSQSVVGCLVLSGSRKAGGKPKKIVRFCPSVVEPSSDNKAYRSRFIKAETAQHTTLQDQQRTHVPSSNAAAAIRSISYDRPRQTLTYSVHRYRGRSYY